MKEMKNILKQAEQMLNKIELLRKELDAKEIESSTGGGMVKVKISGKQKVLKIKIGRECVDPEDVEALEELICTAVNQAINKSQKMVSDAMSRFSGMGNMPPGLF